MPVSSILLNPYWEQSEWMEILSRELPELSIQLWPKIEDPESVEYAVFWIHDTDDLRTYPNLRAILAVTAGVEQFVEGDYPDVPIVRMADPTMAGEMASFVAHWVVHFHRGLDRYLDQQAQKVWKTIRTPPPGDFPVGVLGFGAIGSRVGRTMAKMGYPVHAWTRTGGAEAEVTYHQGASGLQNLVSSCAAVVNVLPKTPDTTGLIDYRLFSRFRPDAVYISIGRGATTVEADLSAALDDGLLSAAVLDVTTQEPLPDHSALWNHPRVRLTPHISGFTRASTAAPLVAANIQRIRLGEKPFPIFNPRRNY